MGAATEGKPVPPRRRQSGGKSGERDSKKRGPFRVTPVDVVILLVSAAAIALSSLGAVSAAGEARVIVSNGQDEWIYPLDQDRTVAIPGLLGDTVVHIHDKSVCIEKSPCPNQTCVQAGDIREEGQWIACLPNQVFVRIEGGTEHDSVDSGSW